MGFEQGEIELQPLTGGVDTVTWTAKKGSATTRSCGQHRTLNFIILIQAIIIVVLGMRHTSSYISSQTEISSQRKKNENGSNTQTSSNSPPSSSNKTRNQSQETLVRCIWGERFSFPQCSAQLCYSDTSNHAHGEFLFNQAVHTQRLSGKKDMSQKILDEPVQCLFLLDWSSQEDAPLCTCQYEPFQTICEQTSNLDKLQIHFDGDSTTGHLFRGIEDGCQHPIRREISTTKDTNTTFVVVVNMATLHYLYLPFYREADISSPNSTKKNMFHHAPTSVKDFLDQFELKVQQNIQEFAFTNNTVFVYMASNDVCHEKFVGDYAKSVDFLYNHLNASVLEDVKNRRTVDDIATYALTLDAYGTKFARKFTEQRLKEKFPQFIWWPLDAIYPAACELSLDGDGRHYGLPRDKGTGLSYYQFKARILWHIVKGHISKQN